MSQSPEQYNRTRGPALSVLVMDVVRTAGNEPISIRQVAKRLAIANGANSKEALGALYYRVRIVVRGLAQSGLLHTRTTYSTINGINVTLVTLPPCSASPQT